VTPAELKRLITIGGYTQVGLAEKIGIAPRTMRAYISGELPVPTQTAIAIRCVITHQRKETKT